VRTPSDPLGTKVESIAKVLTPDEDLSPEEELVYHLISSQQHLQAGINMCSDRAVRRSLWYRALLGQAHNILMSLITRELR
jgi:hypothetical protein